MTDEQRVKLLTALSNVEDVIVRAAVMLGKHPTNKELQSRFAKSVNNRDRLKAVLKADREVPD